MVGSDVHWGELPQGETAPAIFLRQLGRSEIRTLGDEGNIAESRVQVDCLAPTHFSAWEIDRAVRAALKDAADVGAFLFWEAVEINGPIDLSESIAGKTRHRASTDFLLRHSTDI